MQFHHSRLAKRASLGRKASALSTIAAGVFLSLGASGILSPRTAAAQPPQTLVNLTYLNYNDGAPFVDTAPSGFSSSIISGLSVPYIAVTANFTGRGYPPISSFTSLVQTESQEAQVEDGDAFIVTPIIDPDLYVSYTLHNDSGLTLTSLTFTLQPAPNLYFFGSSFISGADLSNYSLSEILGSFDDGTGTNTFRNGYQSLTFSVPQTGSSGIADGASNTFQFSLHIPDNQTGQGFAAVISPNGRTPLNFPTTAPEPGSLMLLLPLGMLLGAAAKSKRHKHTL